MQQPVGVGTGRRRRDAIDVFGPYRGAEADNFAASLRGFEDATGIEVTYTGSADFVSDLRQRIESGLDAPDIAVVPQPGVIAELVERDVAVPLADDTVAAIAEHYGEQRRRPHLGERRLCGAVPGVGQVARVVPAGRVRGVRLGGPDHPRRVGRTRRGDPRHRDGLGEPDRAVVFLDGVGHCDRLGGDGLGRGSGDPRRPAPTSYDRWTAADLAWDDPAIRTALTSFDELVVASGRAAGGLRSILQVDVTRAGEPMFRTPAECAMYKQASFAEAWFPDGVDVGDEVDFFVLPGVDDGVAAPMLVGADGLVQFSDDDDVHRLMEYLVTPDGGREWADVAATSAGAPRSTSRRTTPTRISCSSTCCSTGGNCVSTPPTSCRPRSARACCGEEITGWTAGTMSLDEFVATIDKAVDTGTAP